MKYNLIVLLAACFISAVFAAKPYCKEQGIDPKDLQEEFGFRPVCRNMTTKEACLSQFGLEPYLVTRGRILFFGQSCIWNHVVGSKLKQDSNMTSKKGAGSAYNQGIRKLDYPSKSFCSLRVTATLPSDANTKKSVGSYLSLYGGPVANSKNDLTGPFYTSFNEEFATNIDQEFQNYWKAGDDAHAGFVLPYRGLSTSGCTVGLGAPQSCSMTLVVPKGYAADKRFRQNFQAGEWFANNKYWNEEWGRIFINGDPETGDTVPWKMKFKHEWIKCSAKPTCIMSSDSLFFGSTNRAVSNQLSYDFSFFSVSYRVYAVSHVTGLDWKVSAKATGGKKTPLTVFLFERKGRVILPGTYAILKNASTDYITDDQLFGSYCPKRKNCAPPTKLALKGTLGRGVAVCGRARGLNPAKKYALLVSYPRYEDPFTYKPRWINDTIEFEPYTKPVKSPYERQLVDVKMWPKNWKV